VFVHYFQAYHQANLHYMPSLILLAASCMKAGCVGKFTSPALFNHARCVMHESYLCSSFIFLNPGQWRAQSDFIHRGQFMYSSHSTSCQTIHPSELIHTCYLRIPGHFICMYKIITAEIWANLLVQVVRIITITLNPP
jgi:hypothetical protein